MELVIKKCSFKEKITIYISTKIFIKKNSFLLLNYEGKKHYFNVKKITTLDADTIELEAEEVGYWSNFFDNNFDIRELVYEKVSLIEDAETIKTIQSESCYC